MALSYGFSMRRIGYHLLVSPGGETPCKVTKQLDVLLLQSSDKTWNGDAFPVTVPNHSSFV